MSGNIVWSIFDYVAVDRNDVYASGPNRAAAETAAIAFGVPFPCVMTAGMYVELYMPKR